MIILSFFNNYITKNRKNILYILGFLVVFFVLSDLTFAQGGSTTVNIDKNKSTVITLLNEALKAIAVILTLGTNIVGWFLSPEWTSGKIIGIDGILKSIWIMVANVVYFLFAGIFIWIAFMNIVGKDGETYQLQQAIPRFIIGVLIVPFSWFFVQFVISLSNILTAAVLSLPMTDEIYKAGAGASAKSELMIDVCTEGYVINTGTEKALKKPASGEKVSASGEGYVVVCKSPTPKSLSEVLRGNGIYSVMYFYTFGVMKFQDYGKLFSGDLVKGLGDITAVIFKTGFSIIFIVIYTILVVTLGLALFVRVIRFWFFAMLSPIFGLFYFFHKDGGGDGAAKHLSVKNLIGLGLVPVYVSAALAFGIIFILTADKGIKTSGLVDAKGCLAGGPPGVNSEYTKVCWDGVYHGENKTSSSETFEGFVGNFGKFLLQVFGIVFLWMGVMAALKSSDITGEVAEPIAAFGKSAGDLMRKSPTYAPIFPGGLSAAGAATAGTNVATALEQKSRASGSDFEKNMKDIFGVTPTDAAELDKRAHIKGKLLPNLIDDDFKELLKKVDFEKAKTDTRLQESLIGYFDKVYGMKLEKNDFIGMNELAKKIYEDKNMHELKSTYSTQDKLKDALFNTKGNSMTGEGKSKGGETPDTPDTNLPESITKVKGTENQFEIYVLNDTGEVTQKVNVIEVKDGIATGDIVGGLKSYKDIKGKEGIKKILKDMKINDEEIEKILTKLGYIKP